jgi:hypothetical protein
VREGVLQHGVGCGSCMMDAVHALTCCTLNHTRI